MTNKQSITFKYIDLRSFLFNFLVIFYKILQNKKMVLTKKHYFLVFIFFNYTYRVSESNRIVRGVGYTYNVSHHYLVGILIDYNKYTIYYRD